MKIHAYRRVAPIVVDLTPHGSLTKRLITFLLNDQKAVVADVAGQREIDMLLDVPEAYKEYDPEPVAELVAERLTPSQIQARAEQDARVVQAATAVATQASVDAANRLATMDEAHVPLKGSTVHDSVITLTGQANIQLADLIVQAFTESGMTKAEWNDLQDDERHALIGTKLEALENAAEEAEEKASQELRDRIAAEAQAQKDANDAAAAAMAEADKKAADAAAALKYTLKNGDAVIDLKKMDDKELRNFAKTYEVVIPTGVKGDQIRQVIVDALAPEKK